MCRCKGKLLRERMDVMLLSEFAGNEELRFELSEAMRKNVLPHAILIDGAKGTGKQSLAHLIAQYCVCSGGKDAPCGKCPDCVKAQKGIHPDIQIADGNRSGELNIEAIRRIRSSAYIKANEAKQKVYLLLNCEKMLPAAQNAFLKVLEEPPENVSFVLTAVSATTLLQTIRSRTRIFSLYPPVPEEATSFLRQHCPNKTFEEIQQAVQNSGGNIGQALELLEGKPEESRQLATEIMQAIPLSTEYRLMSLLNQAVQNRSFAVNVLVALCEFCAECVKASVGGKDCSPQALEIAKKVSQKRLLRLLDTISEARSLLNVNVNLNFYGTWLCAVLRNQ